MKLRKFALAAILLAGGTLGGLLFGELALRAYAAAGGRLGTRLRELDPLQVQVEPIGTAGYRQKPHAVFRYRNGTRATANSLGYRGPEVTRAKPPGVFRIILLGGSTTHGWGVNDDESIDAHLRQLLAAGTPSRRFEVLNFALDGYDSYQLLERVRSEAVQFDPDLLIVNSGINDVANARHRNLVDGDPRTLLWRAEMDRLRREQVHGPSLWIRAKHYSLLMRLSGAARQRGVMQAALPDTTTIGYPDAADYFERNLRRIVAIAIQNDIKLVFSTPPSSLRTKYAPQDRSRIGYWLRDAETTAAYRDTLAQRMQNIVKELGANGKRIVYLRPQVPPDQFLDDAHLTSDGNKMVASAFTDVVLKAVGR